MNFHITKCLVEMKIYEHFQLQIGDCDGGPISSLK